MKLKVSKDAINAGLQKVLSVVVARSTIPVLSNILFRAEDGKLWLTATDLDITVRVAVEAEVARDGGTTIPARTVAGVLRESPGPEVEIECGEDAVAEIRSGSAVFKLRGIVEDDFPPMPSFEEGPSYAVEASALRAMLQRTGYAASVDETREVLNGVVLAFRDGKLTAVATDGRRLALVEQEFEFSKEHEGEIILPSKTVAELIRILGDEGTVRIARAGSQVMFRTEGMALTSKLIDGTFPNYRQVIPAAAEMRIAIERELLLNAVRRVALLTSERSNSVKLAFGRNRLEISAASPDIGEASETLPVKHAGGEIAVSFNPDFIVEPLRNLVTDQVYIELSDEMNPGVIKTDDPFLYVIMPMRMS